MTKVYITIVRCKKYNNSNHGIISIKNKNFGAGILRTKTS